MTKKRTTRAATPKWPAEKTLTIVHHAPEDLIPDARNARTHSEAQIAQLAGAIREFGFTNPVLIDPEKTIIAGHGRVLAARKLGMIQVPCIELAHLTLVQQRALAIADNKLALNAGWDDAMLASELQGLKEAEFDPQLTGFDALELENIFAQPQIEEAAEPEPEAVEVSQPGDIWQLGAHRLEVGHDEVAAADAIVRLWEKFARASATERQTGRTFDVVGRERAALHAAK